MKVDSIQLNRLYEHYQKLITTGELKLSLEVEGKEVDILEEICASFVMSKATTIILKELLCDEDTEYMRKLASAEEFNYLDNIPILNSMVEVNNFNIRYLIYKSLKDGHKETSGVIITILVQLLMDSLGGKYNHNYGIDKCAYTTFVYWAKESGLVKELVKQTRLPLHQSHLYSKCDNYKDAILNCGSDSAEAYYNYKVGNIDSVEFKTALVTENGKLPVPTNTDLITTPEFSWMVVGDLVGDKRLSEMDYSDEVKDVISSIFQSYYRCIHAEILKLHYYVIRGWHASLNDRKMAKDKLRLENLERANKKHEENTVELKAVIRQLRKDIKTLKNDSNVLKTANELSEKKLNSIKEAGVSDIRPYKNKIIELGSKIDDLTVHCDSLQRQNNKKDNYIIQSNDTIKGLQDKLSLAEQSNSGLRDRLNNTNTNNSEEIIPLNYIVNAIKSKQIVLVGGDVMHTALRDLGLSNIKVIKADEYINSPKYIQRAKAVVIVTGWVTHSSCNGPKALAEKYGVPIMYFNNVNVNKFCRDLFCFLNSK